ncbi:hypothetical protein [Nocardiopsis gilva]|nr:hypothetical protein [Nocardiopsis gilva]
METRESSNTAQPPPTPAEAEAALGDVEQARASISDIRTPLWYFLAVGAWIAPVGPLMSLVPDLPLGPAIFLGGLAVWAAGLAGIVHLVVKRMRVLAWLTPRQMLPLAVIMLPVLVAYIVLEGVLDLSWATNALTVAVGVGIIVFGIHHRFRGGTAS